MIQISPQVRYVYTAFLHLLVTQAHRFQKLAIPEMEALFDVILVLRNQFVAEQIHESEHAHIFLMYGLLHLDGIFHELQEKDSRWKIQSVQYFYPFSS